MQYPLASYEHLLQALQQMPSEARQQPISAWGPGIGVNIVGLEILAEDYIDPAGEGAIPLSQYDGASKAAPVVATKGQIKLTIEVAEYVGEDA